MIHDDMMGELWEIKDKSFLDKEKAEEYGRLNAIKQTRKDKPIKYTYSVFETALIED